MTITKKIISAVCAAAAVLCTSAALPAGMACAADTSVYYYSGSKSAAEEYIASQLEAYSQQIVLTRYELTYEDLEVLLEDIILSRSDMFWIKPTFLYAKDSSGRIAALRPSYYYSQDSLGTRKAEMERAAQEIISGIDNSWSDVRKALYVHDMIALNASYDTQNEIRSAYEVLVKKKGQCVSYAMAYKYILDKIGLDCIIVMDEDISHSWNMVKIGSNWYNVDVTWDDTVPNFEGLVYHDYFMVSDAASKTGRNPHTGTVSHNYKASSSTFDDMFWTNSASQIINYNSKSSYYIDNSKGTLNRFDWEKGKYSVINKIGLTWPSDEGSDLYWLSNYSRLALSGNDLIYNTPSAINAYNIDTGNIRQLKSYKSDGTAAIYGMRLSGNTVYYNTAKSPVDMNYKTYKTEISLSGAGSDQGSGKTPSVSQTGGSQTGTGTNSGSGSKPERPTNIQYGIADDGSIVLKWNSCKNVQGYVIYRCDMENGTAYLLGSSGTPYFRDRDPDDGTNSYIIRSYRRQGSGWVYSDYSFALIE